MNGETNNQTTNVVNEPTLVPAQQPQIVNSPAPQPVVQPAPSSPADNSLGSNVKIAPPQAEPINASPAAGSTSVVNAKQPQPQPTVTPQPQVEPPKEPETPPPAALQPTPDVQNEQPKKKSNFKFVIIFIIILIGLNVYQYLDTQSKVQKLNYECTPVSSYETEKDLDLNSTIVQDLYNKVSTTMREDLAHINFDDQLKRYLVYRQIPTRDFYDSNCGYFDNTSMQLYTCPNNNEFHPLAFKIETFEREYKKLFGANTQVPHANIQLGNKCLGGYQYIEERGEYVQGNCKENVPTSFRKEAKLKTAKSKNNVIVLTEEVAYKGTDSQTVPAYLKNGTYTYTFKLDTNYNYVYVSRDFTAKY